MSLKDQMEIIRTMAFAQGVMESLMKELPDKADFGLREAHRRLENASRLALAQPEPQPR